MPACSPPPQPLRDGETRTIAEVAERTGVTAHTLRYYERIGLLSVPATAPVTGSTRRTRWPASCSSPGCA